MQVFQTLLSISSIEQKYQIGPRAKCVLFIARETDILLQEQEHDTCSRTTD